MSRISFYLNEFSEIKKRVKEDPLYFDNRDNQLPLYLDFSFGGRLRMSTGMKVNPNDWNKEQERVKSSDADYIEKNLRIKALRSKLLNIETSAMVEGRTLSLGDIKKKLTAIKPAINNATKEVFFLECWDKFVKHNPEINASTKLNYDSTLKVLKQYCQLHNIKLTFDNITADFNRELKKYFFNVRKITRNTVGKHIKNLKAFMNHNTQIGNNDNLAFREFVVFKDIPLILYLTLAELRKIKELDLEDSSLKPARDLFLFCCFSGLRWSDTQRLAKDNIKEDFIFFSVVKTKRPQVTAITPQAREILRQYENNLPKMTWKQYNDSIKKIGELAGLNEQTIKVRYIGAERKEISKKKYEFMSTHMAKRTYITLFFQGGGREETIMKSTGNSDRKTLESYRDIANRDIKFDTDKVFGNMDI